MRALLILIALFLTQSFSGGLNELRGLEDQEGNTHLFYRIYTPIPCNYPYDCYDNPIWHFSIIQENME